MAIARIRLRRGTAAEWATANPVLADGEPGFEKDTGKEKVGDGIRAWVDLPYTAAQGEQGIPGVADDASVAQQVTNGTATKAALNATILALAGPQNLDGGNASSDYSGTFNFDGGSAA
jgi:hypothetical protein